jgi:hypothetical protein
MHIKIMSGGQTGVDRGALDAALEAGVDAGGWCPEGRRAEDGRIADRYPLRELKGAGYRQRTLQNVRDSEGTVIVYSRYPTDGTELTLLFCIREKKPYLLLDATEMPVAKAAGRVVDFVSENGIVRLNVAGPRESGMPGARVYSHDVIQAFLESFSRNG